MDSIDKNKGAYIYYDNTDKTNILFLYMKLSQDELERALPLSYVESDDNTYLCVSFVNGKDYLGQSNYKDISQNIATLNMVNILTNDYNTVNETLQNLDISEFNSFVSFSKKQLNN